MHSSSASAQQSIFDRLKDSATHFELPSITELTGVGTERAVNLASATMIELSSEFSRIDPDLEMLGYHVANVQFQILPPSGHWCVVSTTKGSDRKVEKMKEGDSFTRTILQTAVTAKKLQKINGFDVVVINIYRVFVKY